MKRILTPRQWHHVGTTVVDSTKRFTPAVPMTVAEANTLHVRTMERSKPRVWSSGTVSTTAIRWTVTDRRF